MTPTRCRHFLALSAAALESLSSPWFAGLDLFTPLKLEPDRNNTAFSGLSSVCPPTDRILEGDRKFHSQLCRS